MAPGSLSTRPGPRKSRGFVAGGLIALYFWLALLPHVLAVHGSLLGLLHNLCLPVIALIAVGFLVVGLTQFVNDVVARRGLRLNRWFLSAGVGLLGALSAFLVHRAVFLGLPPGSDRDAFDASVWKGANSLTSRADRLTPRQRMLRDVVDDLPGSHRSEIETALGPSLDTSYFRSTGRDFIYSLGPARSFLSLDSEWLLIWVDTRGTVVRYAVVED